MPDPIRKSRVPAYVLLLLLSACTAAQDLAIVGARAYPAPDAAPIEDATVLVRDGKIAAVGARASVVVPAGVRVVEGRGKSVTAGFWNSHVHLIEPPFRQPDALPGDARALRARIERGEVAGPRLLTVDMPFFPERGTPVYVRELWRQTRAPSAEVATAGQARERATRQIAAGADGVKLFTGAILGGPGGVLPMPVEIARAAADAAHAHGKPVFAHPTDQAGLDVALASGVDVLAHAAPDAGAWSPEFVARLKAEAIAFVPTLALFDSELRREQAPEAVRAKFVGSAQQQLGAMAAGGGRVLFGTDAGYIHVFDTRLELQLMAAAGLDWRQSLASLTTGPAKHFGQAGERGRLEPGMAGDLVVLDADPQARADAFADVHMTVRDGRVLHDAAEPAARDAASPAPASARHHSSPPSGPTRH